MANFKFGGPARSGGGNRFGGNRGGNPRFGGGGGGGFRGGSHGGGGFGDKREMEKFQATCAKCGKSCEVPFRPTGDRPVYCRDCFAAQGGGSESRPPRSNFPDRSFSKPRFDSNRGSDSGGDRGNSDIKRSLEMINSKLDKLVSILGAKAVPPVVVKSEVSQTETLAESIKPSIKKAKGKKKAGKAK